jgi:hypothetical protein
MEVLSNLIIRPPRAQYNPNRALPGPTIRIGARHFRRDDLQVCLVSASVCPDRQSYPEVGHPALDPLFGQQHPYLTPAFSWSSWWAATATGWSVATTSL